MNGKLWRYAAMARGLFFRFMRSFSIWQLGTPVVVVEEFRRIWKARPSSREVAIQTLIPEFSDVTLAQTLILEFFGRGGVFTFFPFLMVY